MSMEKIDKSTAWELVLTWANGPRTCFPADTREEAIAAQRHIPLRPTLMSRIAVVNHDGYEEALYDSRWPRETYGDLRGFPPDISPRFIDVLLDAIDYERDRAAGRCM